MPDRECYWIRCLRCQRVVSVTVRPTFCHHCGGAIVAVPVSASHEARRHKERSRAIRTQAT
jgi:rRNA maturation endonuclease Nob1